MFDIPITHAAYTGCLSDFHSHQLFFAPFFVNFQFSSVRRYKGLSWLLVSFKAHVDPIQLEKRSYSATSASPLVARRGQ